MESVTGRFGDPLRPLGVTAGVLLVIGALATVASAPWTIHPTAIVAIQLIAAAVMAGIGAALAYLGWTAEE